MSKVEAVGLAGVVSLLAFVSFMLVINALFTGFAISLVLGSIYIAFASVILLLAIGLGRAAVEEWNWR